MKYLVSMVLVLMLYIPASATVTYTLVGGVSTFTVTGTGLLMNDVIRDIIALPGYYGSGTSLFLDDAGTNSAVSSYVFHADLVIGDGSTATSLTSKTEFVYIADGYEWDVLDQATLTLGAKHWEGLYPQDGSSWSFAMNKALKGAAINLYASTLTNRGARFNSVHFKPDALEILGCTLQGSTDKGTQFVIWLFNTDNNDATINDSNFLNIMRFHTDEAFVSFQRNIINEVGAINVYQGNIIIEDAIIADLSGKITKNATAQNVIFLNPISVPDSYTILGSTGGIFKKYTVNPVLSSWDGTPCQGVQVYATDRSGVSLWAAATDANGEVVEGTLSSTSWYSTSETKGYYSPYEFTFQANGYKTLVLTGVTPDGSTSWPIELQPISHPPAPWIFSIMGDWQRYLILVVLVLLYAAISRAIKRCSKM